jgi:hypothetical protein
MRTGLNAAIDNTANNIDTILTNAKEKKWPEFKANSNVYIDDRNVAKYVDTLQNTKYNENTDIQTEIIELTDIMDKYKNANALLQTKIPSLIESIVNNTNDNVVNSVARTDEKITRSVNVVCNKEECCVKKSNVKGGKRSLKRNLKQKKRIAGSRRLSKNKGGRRVSHKKRGGKTSRGGRASRKNNRK